MTAQLHDVYKECEELFEALQKALSNNDGHDLTRLRIFDQYERFQIWSGNIGARQYAEVKTSLDWRIREAPKLKRQIAELLEDVNNSLDEIRAIISGERPNRTSTPIDDQNGTTDVNQSLSELDELVEMLVESIAGLFKMSLLIQRATPRDRFVKAQSSNKEPFNPAWDVLHVGHKFPSLMTEDKVWLQKRFGLANAQRRQFFRYARDHREKKAAMIEAPVNIFLDIPSSSLRPTETNDNDKLDMKTVVSSQKPASSSAPTKASTLAVARLEVAEEELDDDAMSHTSFATSVGDSSDPHRLRVPKLELFAMRGSQFECPYCFTIVQPRSQEHWKRHVYEDLRPYICTFKGCDVKLFTDRRTWFEHEIEQHRKAYQCRFCTHQSYIQAEDLKKHLLTKHQELCPTSSIPAMLKASEEPQESFDPSTCPCCTHWSSELRSLNAEIPENDKILVTGKQFRNHLAVHQEQLALFTLPNRYGDADEDVASEGVATGGSVGALTDISPSSGSSALAASDNLVDQSLSRFLEVLGENRQTDEDVLVSMVQQLMEENSHIYTEGTSNRGQLPINTINMALQILKPCILGIHPSRNQLAKITVDYARQLATQDDGSPLVMLSNAKATIDMTMYGAVARRMAFDRWIDGFEIFIRAGMSIDVSLDQYGNRAIHICQLRPDEGFLEYLINSGADLSIKNDIGVTALHDAARYQPTNIQMLLRHGASLNELDSFGQTPLHCAVCASNVSGVKILVDCSADTNTIDKWDDCPLTSAVMVSDSFTRQELVTALLGGGASIHLWRHKVNRSALGKKLRGLGRLRDIFEQIETPVFAEMQDYIDEAYEERENLTIPIDIRVQDRSSLQAGSSYDYHLLCTMANGTKRQLYRTNHDLSVLHDQVRAVDSRRTSFSQAPWPENVAATLVEDYLMVLLREPPEVSRSSTVYDFFVMGKSDLHIQQDLHGPVLTEPATLTSTDPISIGDAARTLQAKAPIRRKRNNTASSDSANIGNQPVPDSLFHFDCSVACDKTINDWLKAAEFRKHCRISHLDSTIDELVANSQSNSGEESFVCYWHYCTSSGQVFDTKTSMRWHYQSSHEDQILDKMIEYAESLRYLPDRAPQRNLLVRDSGEDIPLHIPQPPTTTNSADEPRGITSAHMSPSDAPHTKEDIDDSTINPITNLPPDTGLALDSLLDTMVLGFPQFGLRFGQGSVAKMFAHWLIHLFALDMQTRFPSLIGSLINEMSSQVSSLSKFATWVGDNIILHLEHRPSAPDKSYTCQNCGKTPASRWKNRSWYYPETTATVKLCNGCITSINYLQNRRTADHEPFDDWLSLEILNRGTAIILRASFSEGLNSSRQTFHVQKKVIRYGTRLLELLLGAQHTSQAQRQLASNIWELIKMEPDEYRMTHEEFELFKRYYPMNLSHGEKLVAETAITRHKDTCSMNDQTPGTEKNTTVKDSVFNEYILHTPNTPVSLSSFLFTIIDVEADSSLQSRQTWRKRWLPPDTREAILPDITKAPLGIMYRWCEGTVEKVEDFVPAYFGLSTSLKSPFIHSTYTMMMDESQAFACVPFDARRVEVRTSLVGEWKYLGFEHVFDKAANSVLSKVVAPGEFARLPGYKEDSTPWIRDLFPGEYRSVVPRAMDKTPITHVGLAGCLPLILGLAACSAPARDTEKILTEGFQRGNRWRSTGSAWHARRLLRRRGVIVTVWQDVVLPKPRSTAFLRSLEDGRYGPFLRCEDAIATPTGDHEDPLVSKSIQNRTSAVDASTVIGDDSSGRLARSDVSQTRTGGSTTEPFYTCTYPECHRRFVIIGDLYRHGQAVHGFVVKQDEGWRCQGQACKYADKIWDRVDYLEDHCRSHHESENLADLVRKSEVHLYGWECQDEECPAAGTIWMQVNEFEDHCRSCHGDKPIKDLAMRVELPLGRSQWKYTLMIAGSARRPSPLQDTDVAETVPLTKVRFDGNDEVTSGAPLRSGYTQSVQQKAPEEQRQSGDEVESSPSEVSGMDLGRELPNFDSQMKKPDFNEDSRGRKPPEQADRTLRSPKSQLKSVLKQPTVKFPEVTEEVREGVRPLRQIKGVPSGARWTKIDRRIVSPEALELAKERFEEREDALIVFRVLAKDEIEKLAQTTSELRFRANDPDNAGAAQIIIKQPVVPKHAIWAQTLAYYDLPWEEIEGEDARVRVLADLDEEFLDNLREHTKTLKSSATYVLDEYSSDYSLNGSLLGKDRERGSGAYWFSSGSARTTAIPGAEQQSTKVTDGITESDHPAQFDEAFLVQEYRRNTSRNRDEDDSVTYGYDLRECVRCRTLDLACNMDEPTCANCHKSNVSCQYENRGVVIEPDSDR